MGRSGPTRARFFILLSIWIRANDVAIITKGSVIVEASMIRARRFKPVITLLALLAGCSLITEVDRPVEFAFEELQSGHNFEETLDVTNVGADIFFLGHLK